MAKDFNRNNQFPYQRERPRVTTKNLAQDRLANLQQKLSLEREQGGKFNNKQQPEVEEKSLPCHKTYNHQLVENKLLQNTSSCSTTSTAKQSNYNVDNKPKETPIKKLSSVLTEKSHDLVKRLRTAENIVKVPPSPPKSKKPSIHDETSFFINPKDKRSECLKRKSDQSVDGQRESKYARPSTTTEFSIFFNSKLEHEKPIIPKNITPQFFENTNDKLNKSLSLNGNNNSTPKFQAPDDAKLTSLIDKTKKYKHNRFDPIKTTNLANKRLKNLINSFKINQNVLPPNVHQNVSIVPTTSSTQNNHNELKNNFPPPRGMTNAAQSNTNNAPTTAVDDDEKMIISSDEESSSSPLLMTDFYDTVTENLLRLNCDKTANQVPNNKYLYFVVDTNILLENLTFLNDLITLKCDNTDGTIIFVPYIVLQELDKLKLRLDRGVSTLAVRAIRYLNEKFINKDHFEGQSSLEAGKKLIDIDSPDDQIINFCLQLKFKKLRIFLLSNDINLRNKAICNNINVSTKSDLLTQHFDKI